MANLQSHQTLCTCGSGKPYEECCGVNSGCLVIHFPRAKRKNYGTHLETSLSDLIAYARRYYYNWEAAGRARFTSYTQSQEIESGFTNLFWSWYVIDYRFHRDVSPIIDFYMVEKEDEMEDYLHPIFSALKNSYLSIYQVQWIKNNVVCIRDIFCHNKYVVERDFGPYTRLVEEGMLLLTRVVQVVGTPMMLGRPILVYPEHKNYLLEEVNSLRVYEGINDPQVFLKEYAEVLCGLVIDLNHGIKKSRMKSRTLHLSESDWQIMQANLLNGSEFNLLEKNERWLKFTWGQGRGLLRRLYLASNAIIVAAEDNNDLNWATQMLKGMMERNNLQTPYRWVEGYDFASEEEAEEILAEIMHDKYLEEWLTTAHHELEGMTPIQAIQDVRGRVLLESLLNDMENLELLAKSRGEYCFPTSVIRTKMNLDKHRLQRELLQPEAVAIKVSKHRERQELSSFITAYNWPNEELRQVAVAAFDLYSRSRDYHTLAWILYMWNEFSTIYQPRVSKVRGWLAALEHAYLRITDKKVSFARTAKRYGLPTGLISKHSQLIERHFERYPLDLSRKIATYPSWEELDDLEKVCAYEEVQQHLQMFAYGIKQVWGRNEEDSQKEYYELVNTMGRFWNEPTRRVYEQFFRAHFCMDDVNCNHTSIANLFWENQARRFPPYLKTASFNLMMSYVGGYRVLPQGNNSLIFEDIFTGESYEVYGRFGNRVHENIVPGMISITRLLPLNGKYWVSDPMFVVLPDLIEIFNNNLLILMEQLHPFDETDVRFLKVRGEKIIKAYVLSLDEMEQNALRVMTQPLQVQWYTAGVNNPHLIRKVLKQSRGFRLLYEGEDRASFLWLSHNHQHKFQWGYLVIKNQQLFITIVPGKDLERFIKDIRRAFKSADMVVAFRLADQTLLYKEMEHNMVADLAKFFNSHPELSLVLLRQDDLEDEDLEWAQGIFILKLGNLLMEYLDQHRN
ncbi:MAG: hypothetical protein QM343_01970 [Bacillota bacterium]|nr:hypothetical protein [Bacillota bacterium]